MLVICLSKMKFTLFLYQIILRQATSQDEERKKNRSVITTKYLCGFIFSLWGKLYRRRYQILGFVLLGLWWLITQTYFKLLGCIFPPGFLEEFWWFLRPTTLSVPVFRWYLLALQLFSRSKAELVWGCEPAQPHSTHCVFPSTASWQFPAWLMFPFSLTVIVSLHLCVPCSQQRWCTWIYLSMASASCMLHLSTRAL